MAIKYMQVYILNGKYYKYIQLSSKTEYFNAKLERQNSSNAADIKQ